MYKFRPYPRLISRLTVREITMLVAALLTFLGGGHSRADPLSDADGKSALGASNRPVYVTTKTHLPRTELSAVIPVCRDETSRQRHEGFVKRAKQGNIDLLFLGDSITDWWPARGSNSWNTITTTYRTANFGVMAERTEHLLWRISNGELDGSSAKVVVLLIGINNIHQNRNDEQPKWAANGIKAVVETVHRKLPAARIVLMGLFPAGGAADWQRPKIEEINSIIASMEKPPSVFYLNINEQFLSPTGEFKAGLFSDGLHPTSAGYDVWWSKLGPLVAELMR